MLNITPAVIFFILIVVICRSHPSRGIFVYYFKPEAPRIRYLFGLLNLTELDLTYLISLVAKEPIPSALRVSAFAVRRVILWLLIL